MSQSPRRSTTALAPPPGRGLRRSSSLPNLHTTKQVALVTQEQDSFDAAMEDFSNLTNTIAEQIRFEKEQQQSKSSPKKVDWRRESITKSMRFLSFAHRQKSPQELETGWLELLKDNDTSYPAIAFENLELNIPYPDFFKFFWSTHALYPISLYQAETIGDKDIDTCEWISNPQDASLSRSVEYMHPSTAPMGPPMAKTTKDQMLQTFGTHGMVLQTTTSVLDVPMADCFVLEDRILVSQDQGMARVSCRINIVFVKSTMWKSVISSNAKKGLTKWLKGYAAFLQTNCPQTATMESIQE